MSRFDFCNRSGTNLRLYFDGTEIFMVQVPDGDSVAIEFKSGLYDLLIVAPKFRDNTVVAPFYQRVKLEGVYHDLFQLHGAGPVKPCPDRHEPIRRLP